MANNDTIKKTVIVTVLLCFVCSVIVSTAAVLLKPMQIVNQELDFKRNILSAAGLLEAGGDVEQIFSERVVMRAVDINTGRFTDEVDLATYDQRQAARDPSLSTSLTKQEDIAGISRRENYAVVYLIEDADGLSKIVLPVKGYGLWSTLYGFLALEADANTVAGLGFYEHGETPGLGGEIDNPVWKSQWEGKKIYDDNGEIAITVVKGQVDPSSSRAEYQVDGLSGATLTARGVHDLVRYWLGENGFKPFLDNLQNGEA